MDRVWWRGVLDNADALVVLRDTPTTEDDVVVEAATVLRDALRPYV
jgi:hypothetical protein